MLQRLEYQSLWRRFNSLVVYLDVLCMSPSVLFSTWLLKNKLISVSTYVYSNLLSNNFLISNNL